VRSWSRNDTRGQIIPAFPRGEAATTKKNREASFEGADGAVVNSPKILYGI
jgi:hypothetical protein